MSSPRLRQFLTALGAFALLALLVAGTFAGLQALREAEGASPPARGERVEIGEGGIFVQRFGPASGRAVVIVPGTAAWSGFWVSAAEALGRAGYAVVAVDLPPFGFSDRPPAGDYGRAAQAERLSRLIGAMRLDRPVVLAHSFGAGAAVELAMCHGGQLGGLLLVDGALALRPDGATESPESPWLKTVLSHDLFARAAVDGALINPLLTRRLLAGLLARPEAATPEAVETLQIPYRRPGTSEAYARWLPFLLFADAEAFSANPARYAALAMPVGLIWGGADSVTPLAQGERLARLIPGARIEVLPGLGHIPHIEDEAAFVAAAVRRLKEMKRL